MDTRDVSALEIWRLGPCCGGGGERAQAAASSLAWVAMQQGACRRHSWSLSEACELGMVTPQHPAVYLRAFSMFVCGAFGVGRGFLSAVPPYLMQKQRERFLADHCQVACKQSSPLSFVCVPPIHCVHNLFPQDVPVSVIWRFVISSKTQRPNQKAGGIFSAQHFASALITCPPVAAAYGTAEMHVREARG